MIQTGNFFFKYRNLLFPIFGLSIFIPSPVIVSAEGFGGNYYSILLFIGLVIAFLGQLIRALTIGLKYIVRGGKKKMVYAEDLVTDGIFRHCRNPLYVGNIMMLLGVSVLSNSLLFLMVVVPLFCFIYQSIILAEEHYLANKFGDQYLRYKKDVNRWLFKIKGLRYTFQSMEFNWRRYVINEYNTVYLLLLSITIVLFRKYPRLLSLPNEQKLKVFVVVFLLLSALYLVARYLKKSRRLTAV